MSRSHHHSLCRKKYEPTQSAQSKRKPDHNRDSFTPAGSLLSAPHRKNAPSSNDRSLAILGTVVAQVSGKTGTQRVRLALDSCSTRSFARLNLLKRIGATHTDTEQLGLAGIGCDTRRYDSFGCYDLVLKCVTGEDIPITVNGLKNITCPVEKHLLSKKQYPILGQLQISDQISTKREPVRIDLLIGLDQYYRLVNNIAVRLSDTLVILETKLRYVVNGSSPQSSPSRTSHVTVMFASDLKHHDQELGDNLQRLWELEDVRLGKTKIEEENLVAERKFREEIAYDAAQKRYAIRWPWKEHKKYLPLNYGLTFGRLKSLVRQLRNQTLINYNKTILDQLQRGIIEVAPDVPTGEELHYIPHHCVVRPDHTTTQLRIVYDASAKASKDDPSLNESMYPGPPLLNDLCGIIIRFRQHRVGLATDIEKAFLQISIKPIDRDVTRFLWIKDITKPVLPYNLVTYRFTSVLLGVTASPFMLARTIKHHLSTLDSSTSIAIWKNCYGDNVIVSVDSTEEVVQFNKEAKLAFDSASMNLRQWISNDQQFLNRIDDSDLDRCNATSILGLRWNLESDTLGCKTKIITDESSSTKRKMLKKFAQLFDPRGLFSPVTVVGKILLQRLWKHNIDWDEEVPPDLQENWEAFSKSLQGLPELSVPRYVGASKNCTVDLHCFVDASVKAYCAAIYQISTDTSRTDAHLIFAKVKLSPVKQNLTIPSWNSPH